MKARRLTIFLLGLGLVCASCPPANSVATAELANAAAAPRPVSDAPWSGNVQVSDASGFLPSVAVDQSRNAYVVWVQYHGWEGPIGTELGFSYRPAGGSWGATVAVSPDWGGILPAIRLGTLDRR